MVRLKDLHSLSLKQDTLCSYSSYSIYFLCPTFFALGHFPFLCFGFDSLGFHCFALRWIFAFFGLSAFLFSRLLIAFLAMVAPRISWLSLGFLSQPQLFWASWQCQSRVRWFWASVAFLVHASWLVEFKGARSIKSSCAALLQAPESHLGAAVVLLCCVVQFSFRVVRESSFVLFGDSCCTHNKPCLEIGGLQDSDLPATFSSFLATALEAGAAVAHAAAAVVSNVITSTALTKVLVSHQCTCQHATHILGALYIQSLSLLKAFLWALPALTVSL